MSQDLEKEFLYFVRKRHQRKRQKTIRQIGIFALILGLATLGFYLIYRSILSVTLSNSSVIWQRLLWPFLGVLIIGVFVAYILKQRAANNPTAVGESRLKRLSRIKGKYVVGLLLLTIAILYQVRPGLINDPVAGVINRIRYSPEPPAIQSLWPWEAHQNLHPAIATMKPEDEQSIESVAAYIAQQESDPYLQVKAIHDYVVSRVTYDLAVLETGVWPEQDAETVFETGKAVCQGYANLFRALGKAMGLDVVYLTGKVRQDLAPVALIPAAFRFLESDYDWTNHAWNAVRVGDNWQLVDTTWDAGDPEAADDSYRADYLMPPPEVMIMSHLPQQRDWQLLENTTSYRAFEQQPILTPDFFKDQLEMIAPSHYQTSVPAKAVIEIKSPPNYAKDVVAIFAKRQASRYLLWNLPPANPFTQEDGPARGRCQSRLSLEGTFMIACEFPDAGDYQVLLYTREAIANSERPRLTAIGQFRFEAARGVIDAEAA